jgi:predicted thioesterase
LNRPRRIRFAYRVAVRDFTVSRRCDPRFDVAFEPRFDARVVRAVFFAMRGTSATAMPAAHEEKAATHGDVRHGDRGIQSTPGRTAMPELAVGLTHVRKVTVTDDMTPGHLRGEPIRVLSTPDMIRLIEQTAIEAVRDALAPGQATVGTRVDVAHVGAALVGMTVTVAVELTEIDRRRLGFRVEVRDELDDVGKGTHDRFVVDGAQRLPRLQEKLNRWKAAGGKPS